MVRREEGLREAPQCSYFLPGDREGGWSMLHRVGMVGPSTPPRAWGVQGHAGLPSDNLSTGGERTRKRVRHAGSSQSVRAEEAASRSPVAAAGCPWNYWASVYCSSGIAWNSPLIALVHQHGPKADVENIWKLFSASARACRVRREAGKRGRDVRQVGGPIVAFTCESESCHTWPTQYN